MRAPDEILPAIFRLRELIVDGTRSEDGSADVVAELSAGLAGLEDQLERDRADAFRRPEERCPVCALVFRWPGELADHLDQHALGDEPDHDERHLGLEERREAV